MVHFVSSMRWAFLIVIVGVVAIVAVMGLVLSGGDHVGTPASWNEDGSKAADRPRETQLPAGIVKVGKAPLAGDSQTFQEAPLNNPLTQFIDSHIGWFAARDHVWRTEDGGASWRQICQFEGREIRALEFVDATHGWALAEGRLYETADAGRQWELSPQPRVPMTVYFFNEKVGWLSNSNGHLGRSRDGGATWSDICDLRTLVPNDPSRFTWYFEMIHFCTPLLGFALDNAQTLYRTDDGGAAWRAVMTRERIVSVYFLDSETGWAIGDSGTYRLQVCSVH